MTTSRRFLFGVFISRLGDSFSFMAFVLILSGQGMTKTFMSLFLLARYAPSIFTGIFIRNHFAHLRKKQLLISCYCVSGFLTLLAACQVSSPSLLLITSFLLGSTYGVYVPLQKAWIPEIYKSEKIRDANSCVQIADLLAKTFGFMLAGLTIQKFGPSLAFELDAISFFAIATLFLTIPERRSLGNLNSTENQIEIDSRLIFLSLIFALAWVGTGALFALEANYAKEYLKSSDTSIALLFAMASVGSLVAPRLLRKWLNESSNGALGLSAVLEMVFVGGYAASPSLAVACIFIIGYGLLLTFRHIWMTNWIHSNVRAKDHVKAFVIQQGIANFAMLLGMGLSGPFADQIGCRLTIISAATISVFGIGLLGLCYCLTTPTINRLLCMPSKFKKRLLNLANDEKSCEVVRSCREYCAPKPSRKF